MTLKRAGGAFILFLIAFSALKGGAFAANDPLFGQQWGLHRIQAEAAWGPAASGAGIVVALIDTGVNFGHPDLAGKSAGELNSIPPQERKGPCESGGGDNNGHGTQVAGIVAAASNNGQGVASVAPGAMILSVKALDCKGSGYLSDVSRGIRMAADHGARVINLSLGYEIGILGAVVSGLIGQDETREFQAAMNYAASKGALVVAAAGNDALQSSYAGMENVLVVGASGPNDEHPTYSSSGAEVMAPGGNATGACGGRMDRCIVTTDGGGGYAAVEGTSFAAPHVSGLAALLFRQGHGASGVRSVISSTADSVPAGPRVNAARAVGAPVAAPGAGNAGPGVQSQGEGHRAEKLPEGPGGTASPSSTAAAGKAKSTSGPAAGGSGPGGAAGPVPAGGASPATLVLGSPQGAPPEVPGSVAGGNEKAGAGEPPSRLASERDGPSKIGLGWIAGGLTAAAAAGSVFFWRRRRIA